jgi:putative ABC transport system ATP-binding protein
MIEVSHVSKVYGEGKNSFRALFDVNFKVDDGASVAIVGKSGSGKSTLMHAMSGLDRPQQGRVVIGGRDILELRRNKVDEFRAEEMSFVFQSFFVIGNETCYENVSLPLEIRNVRRGDRGKRIRSALEAVGLLEKVTARARDLSGGQKQRLAIARAIVNEPKILFADEPTGNLDTVTGQEVIDLLFAYNRKRGVTLFVVTHDAELAVRCDMQIHLVDGKVDKIWRGKGRPYA